MPRWSSAKMDEKFREAERNAPPEEPPAEALRVTKFCACERPIPEIDPDFGARCIRCSRFID